MALERERRAILAHQSLFNQVRARVRAYVRNEWSGLGSWRDADIERFIGRVVPIVTSGQRQIGQLTVSYLDAMARLAGHAPLAPIAVRSGEALRGVPPEMVYYRPGKVTWWALSEGKSLGDAVALGLSRASVLADADMQLAQVGAAFDRLSGDNRVVGYERVLNSGKPCELCELASTQRYYREDLMPIHDHCSCTVVSIFGTEDPGQVINRERLDEIHARRETPLERTWDDVAVREHGELGSVLTWKSHDFTGQHGYEHLEAAWEDQLR